MGLYNEKPQFEVLESNFNEFMMGLLNDGFCSGYTDL